MKPLIGISAGMNDNGGLSLSKNNYDTMSEHGGLSIVLPHLRDEGAIKQLAEKLDGLLLTGGGDIDPTLFGEEPHKDLGNVTPRRDFFELTITKEMLTLNKPILGICRGSQILNVATQGTLYQDIYAQKDGNLLQHSQKAPRNHASHFVQIDKETLLYEIVQSTKVKVNTFHHQAIKDVGEHMKISSMASDTVIESIESETHSFVLGVQWHPEYLTDDASQAIFNSFIKACTQNEPVHA